MGLVMYDTSYAAPKTPRHYFAMYTPRAQAAFHFQSYFFDQKSKLADLLISLGQEAKAAPFPLCLDYPELIAATTQLLNDATVAAGFTFDQIQNAGVEIAPFAEQIRTVETVAEELRSRAMALCKPASLPRKRGRRDVEDDEGPSFSMTKRSRNVAAEYDMAFESTLCGPHAEPFLQTAWWTQPICE